MKKMKLVLVGNGMAGVRTLEELLKIAPDLYEITVFGAEPHPNYNRILLSPVLAGEKTVDDIMLNSRDWYAQHGIELIGRCDKRIEVKTAYVMPTRSQVEDQLFQNQIAALARRYLRDLKRDANIQVRDESKPDALIR